MVMSISRRQFIIGTPAGLILPSHFDKVFMFFENNEGMIEPQRLRIRLLKWQEIAQRSDNDYPAEVLNDGDQLRYRARGVTVPITEHEARMVIGNPYMYYFSTALKLHNRIRQKIGQRK